MLVLYLIVEFGACEGTVMAIRSNASFVDAVNSGDLCGIVLDKTNYYAEQGGQMFDTGVMTADNVSLGLMMSM